MRSSGASITAGFYKGELYVVQHADRPGKEVMPGDAATKKLSIFVPESIWNHDRKKGE